MLVDSVTLQIKAGNGGDGAATFLRNGMTAKGGPDGGNGGNGGDIYFQGSHNLRDLKEFRYKKKLAAIHGTPGKNKKLFGKNAPDLTIYVPLGTQITDTTTGKLYEVTDTQTPILMAKGGIGGRGNTEFKSATNQSPMEAEAGTMGEEKELTIELKLIAEIGLIGLPNAGKSSLLTVLTNATPKIGNYPFTTLEPSLGMLGDYAIADIPGLIEGASTGKGLGIKFLKHIEKTKIIVHCIESTATDAEKRYQTVRQEFEQYNPVLLEKPELIVLTKTDIADKKIIKKNKALFTKQGKDVLTCSIDDHESLLALKDELEKMLKS